MKKNITLWYLIAFFRSLNFYLLVASIGLLCFCIVYELSLVQIPAYYKWGYGLGKLIVNLIYGYLTGFIFYLFTVHQPLVKKKLNCTRLIVNNIAQIERIIKSMYLDLGFDKNTDFKIGIPDVAIEKKLLQINPRNPVSPKSIYDANYRVPNQFDNFYSYFNWKATLIINNIDVILNFQEILSENLMGDLIELRSCLSLDLHNDPIFLINSHSQFMMIYYKDLITHMNDITQNSNQEFSDFIKLRTLSNIARRKIRNFKSSLKQEKPKEKKGS